MNTAFERKDQKDEWLTPPYIVDALAPFDLDPCAPVNRPWNTAWNHYTVEDDGLSKEWHGFVWCNPPYGTQTGLWLEKMAKHNRGIALVFARTDTKMFHEQIFGKATSVFFIKGRLKFYSVEGREADSAGAPSCLVAYGYEARNRIAKAIRVGNINAVEMIRV